jgi:hypothetical protein
MEVVSLTRQPFYPTRNHQTEGWVGPKVATSNYSPYISNFMFV